MNTKETYGHGECAMWTEANAKLTAQLKRINHQPPTDWSGCWSIVTSRTTPFGYSVLWRRYDAYGHGETRWQHVMTPDGYQAQIKEWNETGPGFYIGMDAITDNPSAQP